jgi:hypothetical protein
MPDAMKFHKDGRIRFSDKANRSGCPKKEKSLHPAPEKRLQEATD